MWSIPWWRYIENIPLLFLAHSILILSMQTNSSSYNVFVCILWTCWWLLTYIQDHFLLLCSFIIYTNLYYMANKNAIISKVLYDLCGYGSMKETTKDASAIDKSIEFSDVKEWFDSRLNSKSQVKGTISFVAKQSISIIPTRLDVHQALDRSRLRDGDAVYRCIHQILRDNNQQCFLTHINRTLRQ